MFDHLKAYNLVLGSGSPRRKELLSQLGLLFDVVKGTNEEHFPDELLPEKVAEYLAVQKAQEIRQVLDKKYLLITADTIVCRNNDIMGKPLDLNEARKMLGQLSNETHQVITGVCICTASRQISFADVTEVDFEEMTNEEVEFYIQNYAVLDKAGAYGIQDWIGLSKVKRITGSFYTVMGLPVHKVYSHLRAWHP